MVGFFEEFFGNPGFSQAFGIIISLITFVFLFSHNIKKRRRTRALEFITQITITEPMITESHKMYNLLLKYKDKKPSAEELDENELRTVMLVCSFYEFVGLSLLQKLLNQEIILLSRYAAMEQTWNTFEDVIKARRDALDRGFLFGSFEKAVNDYRDIYTSLQNKHYPEQV